MPAIPANSARASLETRGLAALIRSAAPTQAELASNPASSTPVSANQRKRGGGSVRGTRAGSSRTASEVTTSVSRRKSRIIMGMNISCQAVMGRSPRPPMKKSSDT